MALDLVLRHSSKSANTIGSGTYTTSSFTTRNNSLQVAIAAAMADGVAGGFTGASITGATSGPSLTAIGNTGAPPSWYYGLRAWYAQVTTGASTTLDLDCGATSIISYGAVVLDFTGHDTTTPITGFVAGTDADGNGTLASPLTLGATPTVDDLIVAVVMVQLSAGDNSVTEGSGFTEQYDTTENGWWGFQVQTRTGTTSTSVDWVDLSATGTPVDAVVCAFIVKAASAGGVTLTADPASFTLTAQEVAFSENLSPDGDTGGLVMGSDASFIGESYLGASDAPAGGGSGSMVASAAAYAVTAQPVTLRRALRMVASPASLALTGQDVSFRRGRRVIADPASYAVSAQAAGLVRGRKLTADPASIVWTASSATIDYSLSAQPAAYVLTAQNVTLTYGGSDPSLTADPASYTVTAQAVGLRAARRMAANAASFVLTGQAATLRRALRMVADAAAFTLSAQAASLRADRRMAAVHASYSLAAQDVTFRVTTAGRLAADAAAYTIAAQAVGLRAARRMVASAAAYAVAAQAVTFRAGRGVAAAAASFVLSAQAVVLRFARRLQAAAASFTLTGQPVTFDYAGALQALGAGARRRMRVSGGRSAQAVAAGREAIEVAGGRGTQEVG